MANMTMDTIPAKTIRQAVCFAARFVKKTDWMTAKEAMVEFSIEKNGMFRDFRKVCRVLTNYNALGTLILDMMKDKGASESDMECVWNILNKYADPIDLGMFFSGGRA